MSEDRFMWLFVFFDLPVKTKEERRQATQFRQFLLKDGYMMIQWSVYARICNGQDRVDKHLARVENNLPKAGSIRALQITDKQYGRMKMLVGKKTVKETLQPELPLLFY
jgi:CRISPR-associated protein Cas2